MSCVQPAGGGGSEVIIGHFVLSIIGHFRRLYNLNLSGFPELSLSWAR